MLIQRRASGGLRLFEQHAHALICGPMAQQWRGGGEAAEHLGFEATLAIGLHDHPWCEADTVLTRNPATGRPHDFLDYPARERLAFYVRGVDALESVHPYVALLVSKHYTTFPATGGETEYQATEAARRQRLRGLLDETLADRERQARALALLKFFDVLSLYVCLAPPSARGDDLPPWLAPDSFAHVPDGPALALEWRGAQLALDPFPWAGTLSLSIAYHDLERETFADQAALDRAWAASPRRVMAVDLIPAR